LNLAEN